VAERLFVEVGRLQKQIDVFRRIAHGLRSEPPANWPSRRFIRRTREAAYPF
jgi:hypothetical protein